MPVNSFSKGPSNGEGAGAARQIGGQEGSESLEARENEEGRKSSRQVVSRVQSLLRYCPSTELLV